MIVGIIGFTPSTLVFENELVYTPVVRLQSGSINTLPNVCWLKYIFHTFEVAVTFLSFCCYYLSYPELLHFGERIANFL